MLLASLDAGPNRKGQKMQEQPQKEIPDEREAQPNSKNELADQRAAKRKKLENYGFIIMLIGFGTLLIPNQYTGKYGEYTLFAGAMMYFSGRLIK
jgi:hypothetical protein